MDPITILKHLVHLAQIIQSQVVLSKTNQEQVKRLAERVQLVVASIQRLSDLPNTEPFKASLKALETCLSDINDFLKQFAEAGMIRKFIMAGNYRDTFADYNQRLADLLPQLNVGLAAHAILNHEQDIVDKQKDRDFVASQLGAILRQQEHLLREMQGAKLDPRVLEAIIKRQMESFGLQMQRYVRSGAEPKALIAKDYDVNFYDIIFRKKIGEGSFGSVYEGTWREHPVAIKLIEGVATEADREQLIREARIMSRIHSDYITPLQGVCLESGKLCLVMSLMEKGNLTDNLSSLSIAHRLEMARDLARGLVYLHEQGIIHSDIKPANVLINRYNQAKWSDFGLAKTRYASILTLGASAAKSVAWQAPESFKEHAELSTASDIYSFGMLLWSMMTGVLPYKGISEIEIISRVAAGHRERLSLEMPAECRALIQACWSHNPIMRPKASELVRILSTIHISDPHPAPARSASPDGETLYENGVIAQKAGHDVEAYSLYERASQKGFAKAYASLGFFALMGYSGHAINKARAKAYFERGADANDIKALFNLARMYEKGDGIPQNTPVALRLYQRALAIDPSNIRCKEKVGLLSALVESVASGAPKAF